MNKPNIFLEVSLEEANTILKALGNLPFNQVYELIGKINVQANMQLKGDTESSPKLSQNDLIPTKNKKSN